MISISMKRWGEGMELEAHGHAEHGAIGHDIVCAGVSALLYGLVAYLEERCERCPSGHLNRTESRGRLYLRTSGMDGDETAFAVTAAGLLLMARAFPESVSFTPMSGALTLMEEEKHGRNNERSGGR